MALWTAEDIAGYTPRDYEPLTELYTKENISRDKPEARAQYLAETVLDGLTMVDHEILMRTASGCGRPASLNMLEDWVMAAHEAKIEWVKKNISVPLGSPGIKITLYNRKH